MASTLETIKQLYFNATERTIERDLARAVELLKTLPDEESRARAAVYMDGLSQMRSEWRLEQKRAATRAKRRHTKPHSTSSRRR